MKDKLYTIGSYVLAVIIIIFVAICTIILIPIAAIGILLFVIISLLLILLYIIIAIPIYFIYKATELLCRTVIVYIKTMSLNIKYKILKRKKDKKNGRMH